MFRSLKTLFAISLFFVASSWTNAQSQLGNVVINANGVPSTRTVSTAMGTLTHGDVVSWSVLKNYYGTSVDVAEGGNLYLSDTDSFKVVVLSVTDVSRPAGTYGLNNIFPGTNMIIFLDSNVSEATNFGNYTVSDMAAYTKFASDLNTHIIMVGEGNAPLAIPSVMTQINNESITTRINLLFAFDNLKTNTVFENSSNYRPGAGTRNSGAQTLYLNGFYTLKPNTVSNYIYMPNQHIVLYRSYMNTTASYGIGSVQPTIFLSKNSILDLKAQNSFAFAVKSLNSIIIGNGVGSLSYSTVDYSYITNFVGLSQVSSITSYMKNSLVFNSNNIQLNSGNLYQNVFFYNLGGTFGFYNYSGVPTLLNNVFATTTIRNCDSNCNSNFAPTVAGNGKVTNWNGGTAMGANNNANFMFNSISSVPGTTNIPYCKDSTTNGVIAGGCDYTALFKKFTSSTLN